MQAKHYDKEGRQKASQAFQVGRKPECNKGITVCVQQKERQKASQSYEEGQKTNQSL